MTFRKSLYLLFLLSGVLLLASCTGGALLRYDKLAGAADKEDYLSAVATIQHNAKNLYGKTNQFLYYMDIGMLFHYGGYYDSSIVYLLKANDIFNDLFARSISNEAASLLINDNVRPYRSKPYELVLLHQVLQLNYLAKGDLENALVESRQGDLLMQELERKDKNGARYSTDGMFHYISSIAYDAAGKTDDAMISLFKAVEAFKKGPVPLPQEINDYACYMLQKNNRAEDLKLLGISPKATMEKVPGLENGAGEIVVIGYAGRGPVLQENNWWGTYIKDGILVLNYTGPNGAIVTSQMAAPALPPAEYEKAAKGKKTESGTTFHVSFSLPALKVLPSQTACFSAECKGPTAIAATSNTINNLDLQAQKNLDDTHLSTLTRTVIRVVLRTIATQKAKKSMKTESPFANLLINLGTDMLADQLEHADTRCCFLVPKTIQIIRIPVKPGKYFLSATANNLSGKAINSKEWENIEVKKGEKKLVFYNCMR